MGLSKQNLRVPLELLYFTLLYTLPINIINVMYLIFFFSHLNLGYFGRIKRKKKMMCEHRVKHPYNRLIVDLCSMSQRGMINMSLLQS